MSEEKLTCPRCESDELLVYEQTSYWVNTGEYFCNSIKQYDSDADCRCMVCDWTGKRNELKKAQGEV